MKTTNMKVAASLLVALVGVACQGEVIDYFPPPSESGGAASNAGGSSASGGSTTGGGLNGAAAAGTSEETIVLTGVGGQFENYWPSGYATDLEGFEGVVVDGEPSYRLTELEHCLEVGGVSRSVVDLATCTAGTMCYPSCADDRTCVRYYGTATPRCVSCAPDDPGCSSTEPSCVLDCTEDAQCPPYMACMLDSGGRRICMHPDVPFTPECKDSCIQTSGAECGTDKPCCPGLSCESGYCQTHNGP